jgi:hypothetical protein
VAAGKQSQGEKVVSNSSNLKKRRFRQLERSDIFDTFSTEEQKHTKRGLKLNEKMLKKASATVDLISQKVKGQNLI